MIGDIKGYGWDPEKGLPLTKISEGIFEAKDVETMENPIVWFAFTSELGGWEVVNENRVAPENPNTEFVLNENNSFVVGADCSWQMAGGVYTYTVDFNTMTVKATGSPYEIEVDDNIYFIGSMNGWTFNGDYALTQSTTYPKLYTGSFEIADQE